MPRISRLLASLSPLLLGALACAPAPTPPTEVTWYRDVLPVVQESCQGCHTQGGAAPFALDTWEQASAMAPSMVAAVEAGTMPPWLPAEGCNTYHDDRSLAPEAIPLFRAWMEQGAPQGDPNHAPPPPPPPPGLDRVDLTLAPATDYQPSGLDDYHCFVLDPGHDAAFDMVGVDVVPGVPRLVHHVILFRASRAEAEARDARNVAPGWSCYGGPGVGGFDVAAVWVPGSPVIRYPEGTGMTLLQDQVFVMQVHYNTASGDPIPDRTSVKIQRSDAPVARPAEMPILITTFFELPPETNDITYEFTPALGGDQVIWGVLPHMHELGRAIRVDMEKVNAQGIVVDEQCLVDIPAWDFNWQQTYMFSDGQGAFRGIEVPSDWRLRISCTWDNIRDYTVGFGDGTSDEMCLAFVYQTRP